jgi:hypothetical protein
MPTGRLRALAIVGFALGAAVFACSRSAPTRPVATLPTTPLAQASFVRIREAWTERRAKTGSLADYIHRFPDDGATPLVKVYLAFVLIEQGQLLEADGVLATVGDLPPGATRDLATVARARSLRLHNAPQSSLDLLRPLVGKVVDDADREYFLEELALTAIAAKDDYEALAYLDAWLRGVGEDDRDRVKAKIAQILDTLPRDVLEQTYRAMRQRGSASGYSSDTQKLVAARLSRIAVDTNDAALARWLLDVSGASAVQTGGDAGLELGELAASRRGLSVVAGRTVGLLLPTRNRELRDEGADVVRGLSWALDLPRKPGAKDDPIRLVTRDEGPDPGSTRAALEELAGEGAAVILASFDRGSADRVSQWSEQSGLPVILLAAPSPPRIPKTSAVVLGERSERELAMLTDALVRHGVKSAALVVDTADDEAAARAAESQAGIILLPAVRCDAPLAEAGKPRFPVDSWLGSGAQGWLISGSTTCARDVLHDVKRFANRDLRKELTFAVTLEAGVPPSDVFRGAVVLAASAGIVPVLATKPEEAHEPDVRAFMESFGARPSYWTALGRDGGVLAKAALAPLPEDTTNDPRNVEQRRTMVKNGLIGARAPLWTSDDRGIGPDRILPRALRLVTWHGDK